MHAGGGQPVGSSGMDDYAYPIGFGVSLCPAEAEPAFESRRAARWCGAASGAPTTRSARCARCSCALPATSSSGCAPTAGTSAAQALVDPDGGWYWESRSRPTSSSSARSTPASSPALEAEGVDVVHVARPMRRRASSRPIYTRDPLCTVPGGAIIGRMAAGMRRGEEADGDAGGGGASGCRSCGTHDTARRLLEGGSFVKLDAEAPPPSAPRSAATTRRRGSCARCSTCSASSCSWCRWPGYSIHIDGHIGMVDVDKALVDVAGLPFWFLEHLRAEGIEAIPCPTRPRSGRSTPSRLRPGGC